MTSEFWLLQALRIITHVNVYYLNSYPSFFIRDVHQQFYWYIPTMEYRPIMSQNLPSLKIHTSLMPSAGPLSPACTVLCIPSLLACWMRNGIEYFKDILHNFTIYVFFNYSPGKHEYGVLCDEFLGQGHRRWCQWQPHHVTETPYTVPLPHLTNLNVSKDKHVK